jgi:hypothetical protein
VRRPSELDRDVAAAWVASRVGVLLVAFAAVWMLGSGTAGSVAPYLHRWDQWDADIFVTLAKYGYRGWYAHNTGYQHLAAFFPGEPLALRVVHLVVRSWVASALVLSAGAGLVAMLALGRLGALEAGPLAGRRAVLYLALSPYAVFLAAGYSEPLFLAFALPSWLAARRGNWVAAGLLAGGAAFVRIDGLFLGIALAVEWLTTGGWRQLRGGSALLALRDGWALIAPWIVTAGYFTYLHSVTGDWLRWSHAQRDGWDRKLTAPWTALHTTWQAAWSPLQGSAYEWSWRAEILAVLLGIALTITLLALKRWGEATFVGIQVVALATSPYYLSVARSTLLWFPLWLLLARWSVSRRWLHVSYLAVAPALMAVAVIAFTSGKWVG